MLTRIQIVKGWFFIAITSLLLYALIKSNIRSIQGSEQRAQYLREYLDSVLNALPSAIVGLDGLGRVVHWNTTAADRFGLVQDDAGERRVLHLWPDDWRHRGALAQALAKGEHLQLEQTERRMPDGGVRYEDVLVCPVGSGSARGAVVQVADVTARAALETMMVQSEKLLSLGELAAGMAHELNNPLSIVMQSVQGVQRRLDPDFGPNTALAQREGLDLRRLASYLEKRNVTSYIGNIRDAGRRASSIVANMLQFSRKSAPEKQPCNLNVLLDRALELAGGEYDLVRRYDFRRLTIERHYASDVPVVMGVASELVQVFLNCIKNAAQALYLGGTAEDAPRIDVSIMPGEGSVVVAISDNGPGMEEDVRKKVFQPFFSTKDSHEGTGLGLSISFFIITRTHGGDMSVSSEPGKGTTFRITLPVGGRE
ncbi:MAG: nitrogen regulation protein NR(II) [Desulfovibrionaceae bacterium]